MKKILIACCESGGANILASWAKKNTKQDLYFYLDGSACNVFTDISDRRKVTIDFLSKLDPEKDEIITGTSWVPEHERKVIHKARHLGIKTTSVLDHWTNYKNRFLPIDLWKSAPDNWTQFLPDHIWVCDEYAYKIAVEAGFPTEKLIRKPNYYLDDLNQVIRKKNKNCTTGNSLKVLYLSEPIIDDLQKTYGDSNAWGYSEFVLADSMLASLKELPFKSVVKVRFRLHPNEHREKYKEYTDHSRTVHLSENSDLLDDIYWSDIVIGGQSMALVIALNSGKPVYSCIPEKAKIECCLPHKEIIKEENFESIFTSAFENRKIGKL